MLGLQAQGLAYLGSPILASIHINSWILPNGYTWLSVCKTFGPGINCLVQIGTKMKLLNSRMVQEANVQTEDWVWKEVHCLVSVWTKDYSIANVNLDKVCWQSCVLAGALHIQDHKGELRGNGSEMVNYCQTCVMRSICQLFHAQYIYSLKK